MKLTSLQKTVGGAALALAILLASGCGSDKTTTAPEKQDPVDQIAPLAPEGVSARQNQPHGFGAGWQENSEPDLLGYHVYVYGADSSAPDTWARVTGEPLHDHGCSWVDASGTLEKFVIRVTAVDQTGNESSFSSATVAQSSQAPKDGLEHSPDPAGDSSGGGDDAGSNHNDGDTPVEHGRGK
ncbi:MAG: hypothetical protein R3E12_12935 [Candidatus Eisenbacteria bacterium]|uniref:Fibronectin type III domain-containing protein n=1 Tax=Eiseniibacteriota bacterium TaxID=2212470 RepID=A0A956LVZ2_UNCEI|nr:hypothetical protein [Candidatus Eisenbacteria bacterium]